MGNSVNAGGRAELQQCVSSASSQQGAADIHGSWSMAGNTAAAPPKGARVVGTQAQLKPEGLRCPGAQETALRARRSEFGY